MTALKKHVVSNISEVETMDQVDVHIFIWERAIDKTDTSHIFNLSRQVERGLKQKPMVT